MHFEHCNRYSEFRLQTSGPGTQNLNFASWIHYIPGVRYWGENNLTKPSPLTWNGLHMFLFPLRHFVKFCYAFSYFSNHFPFPCPYHCCVFNLNYKNHLPRKYCT